MGQQRVVTGVLRHQHIEPLGPLMGGDAEVVTDVEVEGVLAWLVHADEARLRREAGDEVGQVGRDPLLRRAHKEPDVTAGLRNLHELGWLHILVVYQHHTWSHSHPLQHPRAGDELPTRSSVADLYSNSALRG